MIILWFNGHLLFDFLPKISVESRNIKEKFFFVHQRNELIRAYSRCWIILDMIGQSPRRLGIGEQNWAGLPLYSKNQMKKKTEFF